MLMYLSLLLKICINAFQFSDNYLNAHSTNLIHIGPSLTRWLFSLQSQVIQVILISMQNTHVVCLLLLLLLLCL